MVLQVNNQNMDARILSVEQGMQRRKMDSKNIRLIFKKYTSHLTNWANQPRVIKLTIKNL